MPEKLGLSFHRTFPLMRDMLRQVMEAASIRGSLSYESIRADTTLGTVQVQAARRYAFGVGLLDEHENITRFGHQVLQADAGLSSLRTQWLMHYHMVAPHRNGPAFWNYIFRSIMTGIKVLSAQAIAADIGRFIAVSEGRQIEADTLKKAATIFLRTYVRTDALGPLNLVIEAGEEYIAGEPARLDTEVFAYALADYWRYVWKDYATVNRDSIMAEDGPAALFLLGRGDVGHILREMQEQGLIRQERAVSPPTVYRLWSSPDELLDKVYA